MRIVFLGLSNIPNTVPLCKTTKSGALIHKIINILGFGEVDNLVPFAPLDNNGKLRYPTKQELSAAAEQLEMRYSPDTIFVCLGNLVYSFVPSYYQKIHLQHPAYAVRRGRVYTANYINTARDKIMTFLKNGGAA